LSGLTPLATDPAGYHWLGQIRQAMDGMKTESGLARRVGRIERAFKKEANE
jgi:hypothetical protein